MADETLYQARIHPELPGASLTDEQVRPGGSMPLVVTGSPGSSGIVLCTCKTQNTAGGKRKQCDWCTCCQWMGGSGARAGCQQPTQPLRPTQCASIHSLVQEICCRAVDANAKAEQLPPDWLFHARCEGGPPWRGRAVAARRLLASPQTMHACHARWSKGMKTKPTVGGHAIQHITVGGRTSAYVPELQVLPPAKQRGAGEDPAHAPKGPRKARVAKPAAPSAEEEQHREGKGPGTSAKRPLLAANGLAPPATKNRRAKSKGEHA